nr:sugar ABC transporter ATP-binding protein [Aggregatilinea lenta]
MVDQHTTTEHHLSDARLAHEQTTGTILQMRGITKRFPGVVALKDVDLDIVRGEVHVLVGENGAGKSTLIKTLCGVHSPDEGTIAFEGQPYVPRTTLDAHRAGIRVIYQEFNLLTYLSVAENIFFEKLPRRAGLVDYRALYRQARALMDEVGLEVSPKTPVEALGVAQMQMVEIAKALSDESKVLIMDEPTATLTPKEITRLFKIIRQLKQRGVTIIYISHRLQEIFEIGDRVTVLRNGEKVATRSLSDVTIPEIVRMMVGRHMDEEYPFRPQVMPGAARLEVRDLVVHGQKDAVSFATRQGELVGIAGLVGSGRTEAMRAIFGADARTRGQIVIDGREVQIRRPSDAVKHGICLLTENRKEQGLILDMACYANITLTDLARVSSSGLLKHAEEKQLARELVKELRIRTPSVDQRARNLSGGNQQKVVLAKWLFRNAEIFIFDEPTRGIDVGAKYEIYNLLWDLAEQGKSIVIVSSDLPELMGICHRILVFSKGKIAGEVTRDAFDQETILSLAYQEYLEKRTQ